MYCTANDWNDDEIREDCGYAPVNNCGDGPSDESWYEDYRNDYNYTESLNIKLLAGEEIELNESQILDLLNISGDFIWSDYEVGENDENRDELLQKVKEVWDNTCISEDEMIMILELNKSLEETQSMSLKVLARMRQNLNKEQRADLLRIVEAYDDKQYQQYVIDTTNNKPSMLDSSEDIFVK